MSRFELVCRRHGIVADANRSDRLANAPEGCPECGMLLSLRMPGVVSDPRRQARDSEPHPVRPRRR